MSSKPEFLKDKKSILLNAALSGLLAASTIGLFASTDVQAQTKASSGAKKVPCYGINKCKGTGDCGGKTHSCAGQNKCQGHGWIKLEKDTCLKIKGGSLTPTNK